MSIYMPGCGNIPAPVCLDCPPLELGRIRGFAMVDVGFTFINVDNPAEWVAGIASKSIYLFPYANGAVDIAEQLSDSYGNVPQQVDSYEFTANIHEPGYLQNMPFWNSIKRSRNYKLYYRTQTQIHASDVTVMIVPKTPIPGDIKAKVDVNIMFKWIQASMPVPQIMPTSIFDDCAQQQ